MKILVVEDDITSQKLIEKFVQNLGEVHSCSNGLDALEEIYQSFDKGQYYDLVLMDISMPEQSGIETLKLIREFESSKKLSFEESVKVIMTTALSDKKSILKAFKEQCESYLIKPIRMHALKKELISLKLIEESEEEVLTAQC